MPRRTLVAAALSFVWVSLFCGGTCPEPRDYSFDLCGPFDLKTEDPSLPIPNLVSVAVQWKPGPGCGAGSCRGSFHSYILEFQDAPSVLLIAASACSQEPFGSCASVGLSE